MRYIIIGMVWLCACLIGGGIIATIKSKNVHDWLLWWLVTSGSPFVVGVLLVVTIKASIWFGVGA